MKTTINGKPFEFEPRYDETAIEVIRDRAGLTGTKMGCGGGICGACTVRVNGVPKCSCLMPATHMDGADIRTIEEHGLDNLHPVQRAFMANEGLQCGFCTPGFINEGIAFYNKWRAEHGKTKPSKHEVALAMGGHLCRCAAYVGIYAAIQKACAGEYDDVTDSPIYRVDAPEKVTGAAKYTVDTVFDGQLEGKILRSKYPHAIVKSVDSSAAEALAGVVAVDDLMEGKTRMRFVGQPIAGVAAVDEQTALTALKLIKVDYEVLPAAISMEQAMTEDAPTVWEREDRDDIPTAAEGLNMPYRWKNNVGHLPAGLVVSRFPGKADRRIDRARENNPNDLAEHVFRNHQQVHTALEPHAAVAKWDSPHNLHVVASTQTLHAIRTEIAEHFDLEREQVTVESHYIGGGFGGKQGLYAEIVAAIILARAANAPVRVVDSRLEDLAYTTSRAGTRSELSLLTKADGSPDSMRYHAYGDAGVATGTVPASFYSVMAPRGMKRDFSDNIVVTHTTRSTPFRAPDAPGTRWAVEQAIDEEAVKHGLDPVTIRRRWWPEHEIKNRLLDWVETIPQWQERGSMVASDAGRYKRGIGLAMSQWMFLYHMLTEVKLAASPEGIKISTASQDIGNGTRTSIAKAVEDAMGISRHDVDIDIGYADRPIGPASGGSQVTATVYPCTYTACEQLIEHLVEEAEEEMGLTNVRATKGGVEHDGGSTSWQEILAVADPFEHLEVRGAERGMMGPRMARSMGENNASAGMRFGHGAVVTEVMVDTRLGKIIPLNVWTAVAAGKIHVPNLANSQMYNGVIQGLGYALYEQKVYDEKTGNTLSANLNDYRIPGIGDTPEIHIHYDQVGYEEVRGGGIGIAELATIGVAGSVGNAVYHATGWRPTQTPITPHDVVAGLKEVA
ncbi:MAG: molybdopterin cofactor-binding domain-containing protein [Chloroflexota bacterium]